MKKDYFIDIESPKKCNLISEIVIRGKFKVPYNKDGITSEGANLLKHIIMVITRKYDGHATQPFEDVVVFNDDVNADNLSCSGTFNFKVTDHTWMEGGGEFFITCSLGTYLSNTVIVIV